MRQRHTLEQLKAMSDDQLQVHWTQQRFPFDLMTECDACLTMHWSERKACHPEVSDATAAHLSRGESGVRTNSPLALRKNLEQLYALRLFYDHLYPQPAEPQPDEQPSGFAAQPGLECGQQPATDEKGFARIEEDYHDSRANTR